MKHVLLSTNLSLSLLAIYSNQEIDFILHVPSNMKIMWTFVINEDTWTSICHQADF